jgi:hypothetical protein
VQTLGKYTLGALLGQGGVGIVYASHHPQLDRPVAIKALLPGADADAVRRFTREAQVVAALSHPGIINILDVDADQGRPFIVMELIDGGSLAARITQGPLAPAEALRLMLALADALGYAHSKGIIHRDLKPGNVLLRTDGSPVLADFGLARPPLPGGDARVTATGVVAGTLAYMAPEQLRSAPLDARTDIYALGVMLFEMLTGRLPFDGDTGQLMIGHLQQEPPPLRALNPALPPALERLVARMLAKEPAARPADTLELAGEIRAILDAPAAIGNTIVLPIAAPPNQLQPQQAQIRRGCVLSGGLFAAVVAAALLLSFGGRSRESGQSAPPPIAISSPATAERPALEDLELIAIEAPSMVGEQPSAGLEPFAVGAVSHAVIGNRLWVFGEVRNDGDEARESVEIRVLLLDAAGEQIGEANGFADRGYLAPGDVAPFSVLFDEGAPQFDRMAFEVRSNEAGFARDITVRALRVVVDEIGGEFGRTIAVRGMIHNEAERDVQFAQAYCVFYDAEGRVVGIASGYAETGEDNITPADAASPFDINWSTFSGEPVAYRVYAEGSDYD